MSVSLVRVLLIASWLPSDWRQSEREDRNGPLILCGHLSCLPTELLSFHRQNRVVTYKRFAKAFSTSIFGHYELWKSNTGGEIRNTSSDINMYPFASYFQRIIQYSLLYCTCYFSRFYLIKTIWQKFLNGICFYTLRELSGKLYLCVFFSLFTSNIFSLSNEPPLHHSNHPTWQEKVELV